MGVVGLCAQRRARLRQLLLYLGYGYLDTWHGVATLGMLPIYVIGMVRTWRRLDRPRGPLVRLFAPANRSTGGLRRVVAD